MAVRTNNGGNWFEGSTADPTRLCGSRKTREPAIQQGARSGLVFRNTEYILWSGHGQNDYTFDFEKIDG